MVTNIMTRYDVSDNDKLLYKDWLATPLAEKIDIVVDTSSYKYNFILVYNADEKHYRRVIDCVDIRADEIPLYKSTPDDPLKTEGEVLALIDGTMERVKRLIK